MGLFLLTMKTGELWLICVLLPYLCLMYERAVPTPIAQTNALVTLKGRTGGVFRPSSHPINRGGREREGSCLAVSRAVPPEKEELSVGLMSRRSGEGPGSLLTWRLLRCSMGKVKGVRGRQEQAPVQRSPVTNARTCHSCYVVELVVITRTVGQRWLSRPQERWLGSDSSSL